MILFSYGTRPEWIKIKPLLNEFDRNQKAYMVLFTGQHQDLIGEHNWRIRIREGHNRLDMIVRSIMDRIGGYGDISHVLVQGDTTSALAVALSGFHHGKKVIHLEAGLRTYDKGNPWPEEINRRVISQIADIHLCPTFGAKQNLVDEQVPGKSYVVGNTVIDNLIGYKDRCRYNNKILVTMHRRENHSIMDKWFTEIDKLAEKYKQYQFILPLHPNPQVQNHRGILRRVKIVNPLPYLEMIELLTQVRLVITDSGGLQEECSYLNKKCLVCRVVTERPEAQSSMMVHSPDRLSRVFEIHHEDYQIDYPCPFGDGRASQAIFKILKEL